MKRMVLALGATVLLAGCASYQGGTTEKQQEFSTRSEAGESNPEPSSSPSFRPGMNREDPRDAQFPTRPQPNQVPLQSPP